MTKLLPKSSHDMIVKFRVDSQNGSPTRKEIMTAMVDMLKNFVKDSRLISNHTEIKLSYDVTEIKDGMAVAQPRSANLHTGKAHTYKSGKPGLNLSNAEIANAFDEAIKTTQSMWKTSPLLRHKTVQVYDEHGNVIANKLVEDDDNIPF